MPTVRLPNNGWSPRHYQMGLWQYLQNGGRRAVLVAHRRWGKDELCLHHTAIQTQLKTGTYWHMLPEASQARKAIWDAVNPHTGLRRIDEAFPLKIRAATRENEMLIKFRNGSTWQVLGSDNYNSLVGSPPLGVVFSEYAIARPAAWAYIRPILRENKGWALFVSTPRGKNHLWDLRNSTVDNPDWFSEIQTVDNTGVFSSSDIQAERAEYIAQYGEDFGVNIFEQEYYCSFNAAVLGGYYVDSMHRASAEGRIGSFKYDGRYPVSTSWDLGYSDSTCIWFYQTIKNKIVFIECHASNSKDVLFYANLLLGKPYRYDTHWLPHDSRAKTLTSPNSAIMQLGLQLPIESLKIAPSLSVQDGIQATRKLLEFAYFDEEGCGAGIEALRQYHRQYDEDKKCFRDTPLHDWTSDYADALRMAAVSWRLIKDEKQELPRQLVVGPTNTSTLDSLWQKHDNRRKNRW